MDYIIGIVNYFIVPLITLGVFLSLRHEEYVFSLKNLVRYSVFATVLVPLMHLVLLIPKRLINIEIIPYSSKYTIVELFLAMVLGLISFWITKYFSIRTTEKGTKKDEKQ